jgi:hypothetical protein
MGDLARIQLYSKLKNHNYTMFVTDASVNTDGDTFEVGFVNARSHGMDTNITKNNATAPLKFLFMHIHKGGGTALCNIMHKLRMRSSYKNCLVQPDMRCCGGDSLQIHSEFARRTPFRFVANEKMMYDAIDKKSFVYVTIMRKSSARYLSHFMHVSMALSKRVAFSEFYDWWSRQPDNYIVRQLCGKPCESVAKFHLSRDHLEYAMARLRMFDDIMFLESWDESYTAFAKKYGWRLDSINVDKAKINSMHHLVTNYKRVEESVLAKPMDPLMTALDDALYEFATAVAKQETVVFNSSTIETVDAYFREGQKRACHNRCCSAKCSSF